jgi:hypothetical protein
MNAKKTAVKVMAAGALPAAMFPTLAGADAHLRFAHAVPGAGEGRLVKLGGKHPQTLGSARFGTESAYRGVVAGATKLGLVVGGKVVSTVSAHLKDGAHYSVIALAPSSGPKLVVVPDGRGRRGVARVRVIHAAPELGSPNVIVDGKVVAKSFHFGAISPYLTLKPGKHAFSAMQPKSKMAVLSASGVPVADGSATTVLVVGTRGQKTRFVLTADPSAPRRSTTGGAGKASAPGAGGDVHVVRSGESLWSIARTRLGRGATNAAIAREVLRVWNINASHVPSGDPDLILPGLRLKLA